MTTPRLHPDTIEQVRQAADIVDVVSEHVVLRKQGRNFVGCCPFHDEKTPSFSVSPEKQFYYCFGCGAGGNAIKFLMEIGQRSFGEVVLDLAQRHQVPIQTLAKDQEQQLTRQFSLREQLFEVLAIASHYYEQALRQPQGQTALTYACEQRGLSDQTIQTFQLGYAPGGWRTLHDYLVQQKGFTVNLIEQAGLILPRKSGEGYYDRFRDRLMIPIHDAQSRVVGFGSRTLTGEEPKYLNSPETELFNKRKLLFGLDKARQSIVQADRAVVVEGYFDVIALHAAGITQAVASMGTALSLEQMRQLLRYTESKQIVLNFDADVAGGKAAERAIAEIEDQAYRGDVQLRVLNLPNGKDADEYLQDYLAEDYLTLLNTAPLWLDWQIQRAFKDRDLNQAEQFQAVTQEIVTLLGKLPNATLRTHYTHRCAGMLSQGDARLALQLEEGLRQQVRGQRWHGRSQKWQRPTDYTLREAAEAQLLRIYLHRSQFRQDIHNALKQRELEFSFSHHRFLWRQILAVEEQQAQAVADGIQLQQTSTPDVDLIALLQDLCTEFSQNMQQVYHLLQLNEKTELDILRPSLSIRAAAASLERIACEKRCRHLLQMWESAMKSAKRELGQRQILSTYLQHLLLDESDHAQSLLAEESYCLQELEEIKRLYYQEKRYLQQLDQQRCVDLGDLGELLMDSQLHLN
ncbi:MAG: DNA primase [Acaryochloris sp. SU_5_25]|nr:DNA primase [Acaryochloris sp. SU_5_25]NJR55940.1 DNA primase [Acaryochloris sp. CRU_2_0]